MSEQAARICILGGGFGGLYTALRLSQFPWEPTQRPEIVLVDRNDRFVFLPLLYELLSGEMQAWEIAPSYTEILAETPVRFVLDSVAAIDLDAGQVSLETAAEAIAYDRLVLALGGISPLEKVPGAAEHAYPFRSLADTRRLQETLRALERADKEKIRVAIVGGGYTGVELACKLADRLGDRGRLRVVERGETILKTSPEFNREVSRQALEDRQVWLDLETTVESISADAIELVYKGRQESLPVDLVVWTAGMDASPLTRSLPLTQNGRGQIAVRDTLQTRDREEVYAIGDLAECQDATGQQIPATAQAAFQASDYCAWNLWASLTGRPLLPFRYQHLGEMLVLGTDNATVTAMGITFEGPLAYLARRTAYLYRMPTLKHQLTVGANWISQPFLAPIS